MPRRNLSVNFINLNDTDDTERTEIRTQMPLPEALLILGPTGSGKTPLGELLAARGLSGRRARHFDFGARLRQEAATPSGALDDRELAVVRISLETGALLEDEEFGIAEKLLARFIEEEQDDSLIIMNGLPRHTGQADALEGIINISMVVVLECSPEQVARRIERDTGGDRNGRPDDHPEKISRRLAIFLERTLPLLDYYRERSGTVVLNLPVSEHSTGSETLTLLEQSLSADHSLSD
jgi:adenylate kinase family enzyme